VGAYQQGSDPKADKAIGMRDDMMGFLRQTPDESAGFLGTRDHLLSIIQASEAMEGDQAA